MKKFIISTVILVITLVIGLSFIEVEDSSDVNNDNQFVYAINTIPDNLKDVSNLSIREKDIICATSKGLVEKDSEGKIKPSLAKEINIKDNGIEYEFIIKDDCYWSSGELITADDVVTFFKEILKEESDKNIEPFLDVYGAKDYRKGISTFETGVAIDSVDNRVIIRLNKKNDKFLEELTKPQYKIRKYLIMWEDISKNYNQIVYSGEYSISKMEENIIEFTKNAKWSNDTISKIKLVEDKNVELAMAAYEVGERDIVVDPPNSQLNRLKAEDKLKTFPSDSGKYFSINSENENLPLSTRKEIYNKLNNIMSDYGKENNSFLELAEGSYFRTDKEDLTKLQTRKVMSNKSGGKLPEVITLLAEDTTDNRDICRYIQSWFEKNTKSTVRYSLVTKDDYTNRELRKRYDLVIVDADANEKNKEEFYKEISSFYTEDETKLYQSNKFDELETQLFNNYTLVPLAFEKKNVAISDKIKNLDFDWYGNINFSKLE